MSLSIGIVGLPNVGKSTLFNALTQNTVPAENFPFCTIDPSVGMVAVPDTRLQQLSDFSQSKKTIPAGVEFVDIAGLVEGAAKGEGLGNQFLANIREVNAIAEVVRLFEDEDVHHVRGQVDPLHDIEIINAELALSDLETIQKRIGNLEKQVKAGDTAAQKEMRLLEELQPTLNAGKPVAALDLPDKARETIAHLHLLTDKPILYVLNKKSGARNLDELPDDRYRELQNYLADTNAAYITVDAGIESELRDLPEDEQSEFRRDYGYFEGGLRSFIRAGYEMLDLATFFTTGADETRAWTIPSGARAPRAGAAIHSDFQEKFIKADVIRWDTLLSVGSWAAAREQGLLRTEGKEYTVQDGDVIEFKI